MKYLKLFKSVKNTNEICNKYGIKNYIINSDGSIDVDESVNLYNKKLNKLPLKFRNVFGDFNCCVNKFTSLEGSPTYVEGSFLCGNNNLTNLDGCPTKVGGDFFCATNKLTSLKGCTSVVNNFCCDYNKLTNLEGGPTNINGHLYCRYNKILSLDGFPIYLGGYFHSSTNPVYEVWKLFEDVKKVELFNDYDIIRGTDIVIDRLNDFLITIGKKPVKSVKGYNNI